MKAEVKALITAAVFSALLVSCKKSSSTDNTNGTGTTGGSTSSNPDPIEVTSCSSATGVSKIICLANAFKGQLDANQLAAVQLTYSAANAQKWSNLPQALVQSNYKRIGLNFGSMTTTQIQYAKALVKAVAGTATDEGWDELQQLINADEYLNANGGGSSYGAANYYIALLGTPATTGTFEIQFGGHHTAFANTYKDGVLTGGTPSFRGVEPFTTFTWNSKNNQPIQQEQVALSAMLTALSSTELATAKLTATYSDLVAGPQKDGAFPSTASGIKCSSLTTAQKTLVLNAIKTYVGDIDDANAATFMTRYTNELDNTYISYSGTTGMTTRNDYARIDGPSVWIEYSCQNGVVLSGTHPHSVWRDKTKDYGGN
ncbi:MAG: DUF3500 domain-containing protein [Williamsia sp.]|nr:DUF3500 domain-containing protein [Williamsia sp.]